ncbi:YciI family protein [Lutimaribacter sp. EGI FJ00015]|uniref:YciI family protein n=1 Tax=Lutimaribacter degradans TaxID=2945989 RepID=A0ACC5ZUK3_9RHOB|nr:YciI family protein [Lutimaribacter sp. EGI FJ00013]MCM2562012.1 YciI family protein [Lutimaribacter sp. EGI FJ00013]MCO0612956.1 YciI family protein [Lutimaribacter sp. EGI FJ00015]MCO0635844.1 YciI family protein [Lutimaribacter sp. EGI FJ00014]
MLIALIARDKPGALETRLANREAHLAYADSVPITLKFGGPLLDEGGNMCGSLLIMEVDSMAEAQEFARNDPYAKAGLFESVELLEWKQVIG